MCIVVFSTAHPDYALIVINNRDEFLDRPTKRADWWDPPNSNVLGGRDLLREERGTWLGITREGRIAVLTNFREEGDVKPEARSRGGLVNAFLTQPANSDCTTEDFLDSLTANDGLRGIGGFSLVCGKIGEPLAVISNRTSNVQGISWILRDNPQTIGLSNAVITDRTWTKVTSAESRLDQVIKKHVASRASQDSLIHDLFDLLSEDTLPRSEQGSDWQSQLRELRKSILIPPIGGEAATHESGQDMAAAKNDEPVSVGTPAVANPAIPVTKGAYGTQKQSLILVTHQKHVTFVERTLFDEETRATTDLTRDKIFQFQIDP